jgi:superfamily I DNA/RNA helicase
MTDDLQAFIHAFAESQIAGSEVRTEVCSILDRVLVTSAISDLEELLRAIHTSLGSKEQERQKGAVNLMTMHQAKGLTADAVFIVGAEEEFLPGRATGEEANDERRLLYVSITRAKHFLVVTHCLRRVGPQQHMGSARGKARRKLTSFLSGGPVQSMDGDRFLIEVGA